MTGNGRMQTLEDLEAARMAAMGRYDTSAKEGLGEGAAPLEAPPSTVASGASGSSQQPKHPAELLRLARDLGFGDDDFRVLDTDRLRQEVNLVRRQIQVGNAQNSAFTAQLEAIRPHFTTPSVPPEDDIPDLPDDVHESIRAGYGKLKEKVKRFDAIEQELNQFKQRDQQRSVAQNVETLDAAFDALGESAYPLLGEGGAADIQPNTKEWQRRLAVLAAAGLNINNLPSQRVVTKKIRDAFETLFGAQKPPTPAGGRQVEQNPYGGGTADEGDNPRSLPPRNERGQFVRPTEDDYRNGALARPTHRSPGLNAGGGDSDSLQLTMEDKKRNAVNAVRRLRQQNGYERDDEF